MFLSPAFYNRSVIKDPALDRLTSCEENLLAWFDQQEERFFSYTGAQFKMFPLPVKTSYPTVENVNNTPVSFYLDQDMSCSFS